MSAGHQSHDRDYVFRLPRNALRIVGIAAAVGFLLFLLVWLIGRHDRTFYTVEPVADAAGDAARLKPLPEPLPAGDSASGMDEPRPAEAPAPATPTPADEAPAAAPLPPAVAEAPAAAPAAPPSPDAAATAPAPGGAVPTPLPGRNPPPRYPTGALRRGETGSVVLRVQVRADGIPDDIDVIRRSGSRELDRAAVEAVRNWRFAPAQRDGQPVAASVDIPVDFSLQR